MSDNVLSEPNPTKKPYEKPQLTRVPLRPEEAVLGACKNSSVHGPAQSKCTLPVSCSSIAS